jgi:hypothetical protein
MRRNEPAPGGGALSMPRFVASWTSNFMVWKVLIRSTALPSLYAWAFAASAFATARRGDGDGVLPAPVISDDSLTAAASASLLSVAVEEDEGLTGAGRKSALGFGSAAEVGGGESVEGGGVLVVEASRGKLRRANGEQMGFRPLEYS